MENLIKAIEHHLAPLAGKVTSDFVLVEYGWESGGPEGTGHVADLVFQGEDWPVVTFDSELGLRAGLLKVECGHAVLVYRARDHFMVPIDIKERSFGGAARALGLRDLLAARTGLEWPEEVDYEGWNKSVLHHLDRLVAAMGELRPVFGQVTRGQLGALLVKAASGITVAGQDTAGLLVQLVQASPTSMPSDLEISLLRTQLAEHQLEHPEIILWSAEEPGRAEVLLLTGALMCATRQSGIPPGWGNLVQLRNRLIVDARDVTQAEAEAVVLLSELTMKALRGLKGPGRRLVRAAETSNSVSGLPPVYNDVFPGALQREINRLAECLAEGDVTAVSQVARLNEHLFASEQQDALEALDLMATLVCWLQQTGGQPAAQGNAVQVARWYCDQGAFADLVALRLMTLLPRVAGFNGSADRLLEKFWEQRSELNHTFAQAFISDYGNAIHSPDVVASHRVLERLVEPILKHGQRVLLVVLDGCTYPHYLHLMESLSKRSIGPRQEHLALSLLPSVTSVSRKAIFLAQLPTDPLDTEEDYQEKAKLGEENAVRRRLAQYAVDFFNKTRLTEQGMSTLLDAIRGQAELVTLIINDIDDHLKTPGASPKLHDIDDLPVLGTALQEALDAWRTVVLTADHGHTWHLAKGRRRGAQPEGGGQRFLPYYEGQTLEDWALASTSELIQKPSGARGLSFLYRIGEYLGQQPRPGYHGGAALEEIVVPCAVLARDVPPRVPPRWLQRDEASPTDETTVEPPSLHAIQLTLVSGRTCTVDVPFDLEPRERLVLQTLAQYGQLDEAQLRQHTGTRRVSGIVVALMEKLAQAHLDWIGIGPVGSGGQTYIFREERL